MPVELDLTAVKVRPVLKWVGGKSRLLPEILPRLPASFHAYHEPFIGGGALFFNLGTQETPRNFYLSDLNQALIDVYQALRDCVDEVITLLHEHEYESDHYYKIRALDPKHLALPERAARVLYLNKTCYNGLYRENKSGQFNVPFGRYKNPNICDEPNLRGASAVLKRAQIEQRHFSTVLEAAQPGDFVYFDPPYDPVSATANFTAYSRYGFSQQDQIELRDAFAELTRRGVYAMLSNSDTPFIRQLYADFNVHTVYAARAINSKAGARGKVSEVLVCGY
ncbi:MAG: DNA adenine methylase, partial [Anaerolineae bacterium]|nr:DNA adenine methylase [Anaerolineae bacterium]